jgi:hypothetical protein
MKLPNQDRTTRRTEYPPQGTSRGRSGHAGSKGRPWRTDEKVQVLAVNIPAAVPITITDRVVRRI